MASKSNGVELTDWARLPPPPRSPWEKVGRAIYDPDDKSFLGRTPKRWGIVLLFYGIFYAVLAAFFAVCMAGLLYTIEDDRPKWMLARSLIGDSPGVTFRPMSVKDDMKVKYHVNNYTDYEPYVQLKDFLKPYKTWETCSEANDYGFPYKPCFFIKVNKIYNWEPELYEDVNSLPDDMPGDLKDYIRSLGAAERKIVWVSCQEEHGGNTTAIEYPLERGIPASVFPFRNEKEYKSALVPVRLTPPLDQAVVIRCRAWAKNIVYNGSIKEAAGYARILVHIDSAERNTTHLSQ